MENVPTDEGVEVPESQQLRKAIKEWLGVEGQQRSIPRLLASVGVPKEAERFESLRRGLDRFLKVEEPVKGRLAHHLYARLCEFFDDQITEHDTLAPSFFDQYRTMCAALHEAVVGFNNVRHDRVAELQQQAAGRFLIYKRAVNPNLPNSIVRSYCRIWLSGSLNPLMMVAEYQDGTLKSLDVVAETVRDFYVGICTKKDGVLTLMLRHTRHGAIKNLYFSNIGFDSTLQIVTSGFGIAVETCESFTEKRMAISGCVLKRIPEQFTYRQIGALTGLVQGDDVDEEIMKHVFRF